MRRKELFKKVHDKVYDGIRDQVLAGIDYLDMEIEFNGAVVQVEIHEVPCNYEIADVQVFVLHDDCEHHSPLLEKAIIKALPDWYQVYHELNDVPYVEGLGLSA